MRGVGLRLRRPVLLAAIAVIAVAVLLTGRLRSGGDGTAAPANSTGAATTAASTANAATSSPATARPSTPVPDPTSTAGGDADDSESEDYYRPGPSTPAASSAAAVAADFATAWARPALPQSAWWHGVAPLCETGFAAQLRTVSPGNVPTNRITGPPRSLRSTTDLVVFAVPADGGTLQVTLARIAGAWRVTSNDWTAT